MSTKMIHVSENGPMPCEAHIEDCPIGGEHFDNFEDAQAYFELQMEEIYNTTAGISRHDPYASYMRYGLNGQAVPLHLIDRDSISYHHLDEDTVLHNIGFFEGASPEEKAARAASYGIEYDDSVKLFRVYSQHENLRIGAVLRRQHGIEIAQQRLYSPDASEFIIRTGQDLISLEQHATGEQEAFEHHLQEHGIANLVHEVSSPQETAVEDNVHIGKAIKQVFTVRELREVKIHNESHATHYFDIMTKNEKARHNYKGSQIVQLFADYRSEDNVFHVTMGVEVDGERRYEADPQGSPVVRTYEVERPELLEAYVKNAKQGATSLFRKDLNSKGMSNYVSEYKYKSQLGYDDED